MSAVQRAAEERVDAAVDRTVTEALERHDRITAAANKATLFRRRRGNADGRGGGAHGARVRGRQNRPPACRPGTRASRPRVTSAARSAGGDERHSRRERDIAAFRERRRQAAEEAREEARKRIARAGELACVTDALAALAHPEAARGSPSASSSSGRSRPGRIRRGRRCRAAGAVGGQPRRGAQSRVEPGATRISRWPPALPTRSSPALPRTALAASQRIRPTPPYGPQRRRAFWR